jgi:hypothetical protein
MKSLRTANLHRRQCNTKKASHLLFHNKVYASSHIHLCCSNLFVILIFFLFFLERRVARDHQAFELSLATFDHSSNLKPNSNDSNYAWIFMYAMRYNKAMLLPSLSRQKGSKLPNSCLKTLNPNRVAGLLFWHDWFLKFLLHMCFRETLFVWLISSDDQGPLSSRTTSLNLNTTLTRVLGRDFFVN